MSRPARLANSDEIDTENIRADERNRRVRERYIGGMLREPKKVTVEDLCSILCRRIETDRNETDGKLNLVFSANKLMPAITNRTAEFGISLQIHSILDTQGTVKTEQSTHI